MELPFVSATNKGQWHLRNINPEDHVLEEGDFMKIYNSLPDSPAMGQHFKMLYKSLAPLARPDEVVRERHIRIF